MKANCLIYSRNILFSTCLITLLKVSIHSSKATLANGRSSQLAEVILTRILTLELGIMVWFDRWFITNHSPRS